MAAAHPQSPAARRPSWLLDRIDPAHRWAIMVFALFVLLFGTWVVGMPKFAAPDEPAHAVKAYANAHGDWIGEPIPGSSPLNRSMLAPIDLAAGQTCFVFHPEITAGCEAPLTDPSLYPIESTASTYPPAYYVVVGLAARVLGQAHSLHTYRMLSALLACAGLTAAAWTMSKLGRRRPVLLLLGLTPMAVFMCSAVNPTAIEISMMLLVWASTAVWLSDDRPPTLRGWLSVSSISAVVVLVRPVTFPFIVVAVASYLVLERRPLADDRRSLARMAGWASIPLAVAIVASFAWSRYSGVGLSDDKFVVPGSTIDHARTALGHTGEILEQSVGVLGWLDTRLPFPALALTLASIGGVVVAVLLLGDRRLRIVMSGLLAVWVLYPVIYTTAARTPLNWQGRYNLPILGGIVLCAAVLLGGGLDERTSSRLLGFVGVSFVIAEVLAFHQALRRFMVGSQGDILLRHPSWHPGPSAWLLIVLNALTASALLVVLQRSPRRAGG